MVAKYNTLTVQDIPISFTTINNEDYICLTDMIKAKDGDFYVSDWLRNRDTIEYIGAWESLANPNFNYGEFAIIRNNSGSRTYKISVKEWILKTNAIGIIAKTGRYGGTYAHKDIAFNFGMWISPVFQLYIVKEYQRLKEVENNQHNLEWNVKRVLSKANYQIHTKAIETHIIPKLTYSQKKEWIYADEADMLNVIIFGCTAKQWREANAQRVLNGENIRESASINELTILTNLESLNAILIKQGLDKRARCKVLMDTAKEQFEAIKNYDILKSIKKTSETTYIDKNIQNLSEFDKTMKKALDYNPKEEKPSE